MRPGASIIVLLLCLLPAPARAGDLKVAFKLPETVKVGQLIRLEVQVTNRGRKALVVREPSDRLGNRTESRNHAGV